MHTTAYWLSLPRELWEALPGAPSEGQGGLTALAHALHSMATLLIMCDRRDLVAVVGHSPDTDSTPYIYLYDNYPGGIGLSEPLYQLHHRLLEQTEKLIAGCACAAGCPSCVGPVGEVGQGGKEMALAILRQLHAAG